MKKIGKPPLLSEVTKERLRRCGHSVLKDCTNEVWSRDVGFRSLKIDSSNMADVYYSPDDLTKANIDLFVENVKSDRLPDDLVNFDQHRADPSPQAG